MERLFFFFSLFLQHRRAYVNGRDVNCRNSMHFHEMKLRPDAIRE